MKINKTKILFFILLSFFLINCGPTPEWKEKGFESEYKYNLYLKEKAEENVKQEWLNSDKKFLGKWEMENNKYAYMGVKALYEINFFEGGYGNFFEHQYTNGTETFRRDAPFSWNKIDNKNIEVRGLLGDYESDNSYRFKRFNGIYSIEYRSNCINLRDYVFCK